jgi:hypothetical protein
MHMEIRLVLKRKKKEKKERKHAQNGLESIAL